LVAPYCWGRKATFNISPISYSTTDGGGIADHVWTWAEIVGLLALGMARPKVSKMKKAAILKRIESLKQSICKAREYLESGKHADWPQFRPLFAHKVDLPHKDWVKSVFLSRNEKALREAQKLIDRFD
jgi:hypothetical protein